MPSYTYNVTCSLDVNEILAPRITVQYTYKRVTINQYTHLREVAVDCNDSGQCSTLGACVIVYIYSLT